MLARKALMSIPVRYGHVVAGKPRVHISPMEKVRTKRNYLSFFYSNKLFFYFVGCSFGFDHMWSCGYSSLHSGQCEELSRLNFAV